MFFEDFGLRDPFVRGKISIIDTEKDQISNLILRPISTAIRMNDWSASLSYDMRIPATTTHSENEKLLISTRHILRPQLLITSHEVKTLVCEVEKLWAKIGVE